MLVRDVFGMSAVAGVSSTVLLKPLVLLVSLLILLVHDVFGMSALMLSLPLLKPLLLLSFLLLVRDVFGMSAVAGVSSIVKTATVTSVSTAFACP